MVGRLVAGKHKNRDAAYYRARYAKRRSASPNGSVSTPHYRPDKRTPFIAIDGEALATGEYVLMCASSGETLRNRDGISTVQAIEWILRLKERYPHSIFVAFGLDYDVNMMLRDVHYAKLESLHGTNECEWLSAYGLYYRLEWIQHKRFRIATGSRYTESLRSATIHEVFGFYQSSFVSALANWRIPDVDGALARIRSGKAERGGFKWKNISNVQRYCLAECRMLVTLMDELRDTFYRAGIRPTTWEGAGSAAGAVLKRHNVRQYHRPDEDLHPPLQKAVMSAYYGGRSEVFIQGEVGDCIGYDINSAYPAEAAKLPTLHGQWKRTRTYDPDAPVALWRVWWSHTEDAPVQPFPYRHKKTITYPTAGLGWYWQDEVRAAIALHGNAIHVTNGWVYTPDEDVAPFGFVHDYYRLKAEAKANGDATERTYKLSLNSIYGKLAQGTGYRDTIPWQRSFVWAGLITSGTRARLLETAAYAPEDVVFMATDGIVFRKPIPLACGPELGGFDKAEYPNLFVAQAGIYVATDNTGREVTKHRGLFPHEIDFATLRDEWKQRGPYGGINSTSRRFIGLGTALMRTYPEGFALWRTWPEVPRRIRFFPATKYVQHDIADAIEQGGAVPRSVRWLPPEGTTHYVSEQYKPKTTGTPKDADRLYVAALEQPTLDVDG